MLAYPDVYELGMANLGIAILYEAVNRLPWAACERVYLPWPDLAERLRADQIPLWSLESQRPVCEADFLGITLQYELTYPGVLELIDLSGIPLLTSERAEEAPFVIGGGPCALNPEPLAPFFDAVLVGEGEEALVEFCKLVRERKEEGFSRLELKRRLAQLEGWYVPEFYTVPVDASGQVGKVQVSDNAPAEVSRRVVADLDKAVYPTSPLVPYIEVTHDRAVLEVMRGCTRGCRFCQAGAAYRPVRERSTEVLVEQAREILTNTGAEEISLVSLSTTDHSDIQALVEALLEVCEPLQVNVSLPSLRVDAMDIGLAERLATVRKGGMTLAPEAGTQRLRNVINKQVTEQSLLEATEAAFEAGWNTIKLYFMLGLPTETDEDLLGIADLARKVHSQGRELRGGRAQVNVSVATFVPKPHTPYQWLGQIPRDEIERRQRLLKDAFHRLRGVNLKLHAPSQSLIEALLARGDRRLADVVLAVWKRGARFEGWREYFSMQRWQEALSETGLELEQYASSPRKLNERLPWDQLSSRVTKAFLALELQKSEAGSLTPDCRFGPCSDCGACDSRLKNRLCRSS